MFILKTAKTGQNGESSIFVKLSFKSKSTEMATGKSISRERWEASGHLSGNLRLEKEKVI